MQHSLRDLGLPGQEGDPGGYAGGHPVQGPGLQEGEGHEGGSCALIYNERRFKVEEVNVDKDDEIESVDTQSVGPLATEDQTNLRGLSFYCAQVHIEARNHGPHHPNHTPH